MNSVSCIAEVMGINEKAAQTVFKLFSLQTPFYNVNLVPELQYFIDHQILEYSFDKLIFTEKADELMQKALDLYVKINNLTITSSGIRKPREITSTMEDFKNYTLELVQQHFDVKDVKIDRSNYLVRLKTRTKGIRQFECMNNGNFRIFGYNMPAKIIQSLTKLGMKYKPGSANNAFFDILCTKENIANVVNIVVNTKV